MRGGRGRRLGGGFRESHPAIHSHLVGSRRDRRIEQIPHPSGRGGAFDRFWYRPRISTRGRAGCRSYPGKAVLDEHRSALAEVRPVCASRKLIRRTPLSPKTGGPPYSTSPWGRGGGSEGAGDDSSCGFCRTSISILQQLSRCTLVRPGATELWSKQGTPSMGSSHMRADRARP